MGFPSVESGLPLLSEARYGKALPWVRGMLGRTRSEAEQDSDKQKLLGREWQSLEKNPGK